MQEMIFAVQLHDGQDFIACRLPTLIVHTGDMQCSMCSGKKLTRPCYPIAGSRVTEVYKSSAPPQRHCCWEPAHDAFILAASDKDVFHFQSMRPFLLS